MMRRVSVAYSAELHVADPFSFAGALDTITLLIVGWVAVRASGPVKYTASASSKGFSGTLG